MTGQQPDVDGAIIVITRMFDAPRTLVWQAMTDAAHVARWWGGPGISNPVCEMDVRPGGRWHQVMRGPDGFELAIDFVFLEVDPPRRLVWQDVPPTLTSTATFEDAGAGTHWRMVTRFRSVAERDAAIARGFRRVMHTSLDSLETFLLDDFTREV